MPVFFPSDFYINILHRVKNSLWAVVIDMYRVRAAGIEKHHLLHLSAI